MNALNYSFDFVPGSVGLGLMTHSPGFSGGEILRFSKNCVCLLTKVLEAQFQMEAIRAKKAIFEVGTGVTKYMEASIQMLDVVLSIFCFDFWFLEH